MFKGFDFGKGLLRQVESFRRLNPQQQKRKEAGLLRALQTYTKRYMGVVDKPANANPGLLTNGAEALVEASLALKNGVVAYPAFAELVARSRKIAVVPGLQKLVDRLLELPTHLKTERVALLSWRITKGSLGPERALQYLAERAQLTGESDDWKDYAYELLQLVKKDALQTEQDLTIEALKELLANKHKLGEDLISVQLLMADSLLARKEEQQAETLLIEIAGDAERLPPAYAESTEKLLRVRPAAEWGLHSLVLEPVLDDFAQGKLGWNQVQDKLTRAQIHGERLVEFLLGHDHLPLDARLSLFALKQTLKVEPPDRIPQLVERWDQRHEQAGTARPEEAGQLLTQAVTQGKVTQVPAAVTATPTSMDALAASSSPAELEEQLAATFEGELTAAEAASLLRELAATDQPAWQVGAARGWLAGRLLAQEDLAGLTELLDAVAIEDPDDVGAIVDLLRASLPDEPEPAAAALLARLELAREDYAAALDQLATLPANDEQRGGLLAALETQIVAQAEPSPPVLMVLARTQHLASSDPEAGFEPATTASLLAPDDEQIEAAYRQWREALDPALVHRRRAQQATYLTVSEGHRELLPVAVGEIESLAQIAGEQLPAEPLEWLSELRPLLDEMPDDGQPQLRIQWTRLYLMFVAGTGTAEQIPAALQAAAQQVEPQVALSLAEELGVPVPAGARLLVECETLARQGDWQRAVEMIAEIDPAEQALVPVKLLCDQLPADSLREAAEQMHGLLASRGPDQQLELVRCLDARLTDESTEASAADIRAFVDQALQELCDAGFEPAARYLLASGRQFGDPAEHLRHLLKLSRGGDEEALEALKAALPQLLPAGDPPELLREAAEVVAEALQAEQPAAALETLTTTAEATGDPQWCLDTLETLGLTATTSEHVEQLGRLALAAGDQARALSAVRELCGQGAHEAAAALAAQVAEAGGDAEAVLRELITLQLAGPNPNYALATKHLLRLVQIYQDRDSEMRKVVGSLSTEIAEPLASAEDNVDARHLRLILAALHGQGEEAHELIEGILAQGPDAAASLLELFDKLALEDGGMPTALVVTWGRLLFMAGRTEDALDRLAGLRDTVRDYPEYAPLLAEIRDSGGGPGASMQLGQAYIRVNLWQDSAEEYAAALEQDASLAVPILTQLRHHGALAPNPMQYPLHLLALKCVAQSERPGDWGWALSALTWLLPRWSADELYELASELWNNAERVELSPEQRCELALHLHHLALKLNQAEEALGYVQQAWQLVDEPGPELLEALAGFDASQLPEESARWQELHALQMRAAVLRDDLTAVALAARKLAETSPAGREQALKALSEYQRVASNVAPVLLARLQLLDLSTESGRQEFVEQLLAARDADLPTGEVHQLIRTVLALIRDSADSPGLIRLLLQLFGQLGDQARAWQLALNFILEDDDLAQLALDVLTQLATDEYAVAQQVALVEVHLLRGDHEAAATALEALGSAALDEHTAAATALAEALLSTPASTAARRWLVGHLREAGELPLAADHLVWAHATSNPLPSGWLEEQPGGDLKYRAAQLKELQGDPAAAQRLYEQATRDKQADLHIRAAAQLRLSQLVEEAGDLEQAHQRVSAALELLPDQEPAKRRQAELATAINRQRIEQLRGEPDSVERTIEIARLLCAVDEPVEAIGELQAGLDRGQGSPLLSVELGECFVLTGDYRISLRAFEDVLRRLGDDTEHNELRLRALYGMATAYEQRQDREAAVRCLEQILVLKHNYRDSRQRLQALYASADQQDRAAAPEPRDDRQQEILGEILSMLGVPEEPEEDDGRS